MTRALWIAAWVFGLTSAAAYVALWRELFVITAILAALALMAWGYRLHPDHRDYVTTNHRIEVDQ
ncbi:hypothetical protein [Mycolicibacterium fortuitum]|uniref:hypothetical protein n=1 Tax=Mycolicibacterium fortuitum TaxID=1766 RepID=UPI00096CCB54|nr:hypothetical protein [Mycolicibacterium fortuitum]MBP3086992.1 hypothetical protein [Mycolicibacterium fortuitum]NOR03646.1 hypothetical protein [Mycolicibacterium fortuitum]OMC11153.1 hypothetical protein A5734_24370 [Mycolicibacterium fortuitum]